MGQTAEFAAGSWIVRQAPSWRWRERQPDQRNDFLPWFVPRYAVASLRDSPYGSHSVCFASRNPGTGQG